MAKCPYHDPFAEKRAKGPVLETEFDGDPVAMILGLKDVRKAARDWKTFSSDAPFRVPIPREEDLRSVRQFPIESDPPEHAEYRKIVEPAFNRPNEPEYQARVTGLIDELISGRVTTGPFDAVDEFALPLQSRALTYLLGVPESEAQSWINWGVHVLRDGDGPTKGKEMEQYCKEAFIRSSEWGDDNFFSILNQATFRERPLTDDEKLGFANLAFAGGRDTVINTVCIILAHFARRPGDLERLREEPGLVNYAGEEFVRFATPLTHIGRKCPVDTDVHGVKVKADKLISLCWASANFDETVFENPGEIKLDRKPNPHVAFGNGIHNCLGASHARLIIRTLLAKLAELVSSITILSEKAKIEKAADYERVNAFESLELRLNPQKK
jgi:cytochrome P450